MMGNMFGLMSSIIVLVSASSLSASPIEAKPVTDFLVMADMPYTIIDHKNLAPTGLLGKKIAQTPHGFLMHLGDMKAGAEPCTDKLLTTHKQLLSTLTEQPFVFTPGDNDWTDCDRENLTPRYDELERLAFIKELMFDKAYLEKLTTLTGFKRQTSMTENARWQFADVEFMTLHIAGTHNGRRQVLKSDKQMAYHHADLRDSNNLSWLAQADPKAKAYVIAFQADIYTHKTEQAACSELVTANCDGFKIYRDALAQFAQSVEKPVLVIHGDTGEFCQQKLAANLTRLNAPGDYMFSDIAQVSITESKDSNGINWQITSLKTNKPLVRICN
ncbi:hypothetical protein [Pseudoalteromonas neustonica]|uniref:hypothetical protein n=1 Tax=Pseudoalteromonas neustonica TaxID=1840331 RepID=UPI0007DB3FCD|nr:hypothetical protein [Pseudoalteromonas neustonica]